MANDPEKNNLPVKILLVEDQEDDYILTRRRLAGMKDRQIHLDWESTYESGLKAMLQNIHDVYLLDYHLGLHTGLDLLKQAIESGCEAPIILLTGSGNELVAAEALRFGATDYLSKDSASGKTLNRAIHNSLEKAELRRHLKAHRQHLEETNEQLARKNEEIQRFYHTLAHELKTPLTAGREFTAIMLDGLGGPITAEQQEYLGLVKDTFTQMAFIINDLLDVTRIETGKLSIHQGPIRLVSFIPRVVTGFSKMAQEKGIRLHSIIDPDLPDAFIDEQRIAQVINNLVSNALKCTPPEGEVTVNASQDLHDHTRIFLSVKDTGYGIDPGHLELIFNRLYQVQDNHERAQGGLGLGLTISKEVVKLHGGTLIVESTPGQGSVFSFTVPVNSKEASSENRGHCRDQ